MYRGHTQRTDDLVDVEFVTSGMDADLVRAEPAGYSGMLEELAPECFEVSRYSIPFSKSPMNRGARLTSVTPKRFSSAQQ